MITLASIWLGLSILICAFAWLAGRRLAAIALPFAAVLAAYAIYVPTGTPRVTSPPPAKYVVLGARIDVDKAIYVLLDDGGGEPVYYRLPYSTSSANELQSALDGAQDGQGVTANVDGQGGVKYDGEPPVAGNPPPKQAETPAVAIP